MASRLGIYQSALMKIGSPRLLDLSENVASRKTIDAVYADCVEFCLELGTWDWGTRTVSLYSSTDIDPIFGYEHAIEKPGDIKKVVAISSEPTLTDPLQNHTEDAQCWYTFCSPLYVSYVSNDPAYGLNIGAWTEAFADLVAIRIAIVTCETITQSTAKLDELKRDFRTAKSNAIGINNFDDAPKRFPEGRFTQARRGGYRSSRVGRY
ncbi:hypothetical protein [Neorhizobium sp. AL 9.2.2]|uniref:hypothetical protein n=1 Tax=Neorhizobium sp. AL 9.2.2 TaxID=2712894 RepID=UPI00157368F9|nr:hypothetical protein [Neorhizobium sp. AL 9.2.2]NSY17263.1 hypothetical protein [Neorhizobium sp. AL 9.2.2]